MRSMTGFGCGEAELDGNKLTCELRALNHRFLDVRVRMPEELSSHVFFVEQLARERLSRGRFDIGVRLDDSAAKTRFSVDRARAVYEGLLRLRDELAPGTDVPVAALASLPSCSSTPRTLGRRLERSLTAAFSAALAGLDECATGRPGAAPRAERATPRGPCLGRASQDPEPGRRRAQLDRLRERGAAAGRPSRGADPARLETELALLADAATSPKSWCASPATAISRGAAVGPTPFGRRLEFLLQEMAREDNTWARRPRREAFALVVAPQESAGEDQGAGSKCVE